MRLYCYASLIPRPVNNMGMRPVYNSHWCRSGPEALDWKVIGHSSMLPSLTLAQSPRYSAEVPQWMSADITRLVPGSSQACPRLFLIDEPGDEANNYQLGSVTLPPTHVEHCAHYKHLSNDNVDRQLCQHASNRSETFVFVQSSLSGSQWGKRKERRPASMGDQLSCLTATNFKWLPTYNSEYK